VKKYWFLWQ